MKNRKYCKTRKYKSTKEEQLKQKCKSRKEILRFGKVDVSYTKIKINFGEKNNGNKNVKTQMGNYVC